ncbi:MULTISPECIES: hypothetical protein [unclassified Kribbella]|uniref:hypothetical protein n=1 Tax=unclassified Kribbella TaxID=2644121 RepID=UPI003407EF49
MTTASEAPMTCETTQRLLALLRIVERDAAPFGALGDDAVLDAWFGIRSPVWQQNSQEAPQPQQV